MNIRKLHNLSTLIYRTVTGGGCNMSKEDCLKVLEDLFPDPSCCEKTLSSGDLERVSDRLLDITTHADDKKKEEINETVGQNLMQELFDRKLRTIIHKH